MKIYELECQEGVYSTKESGWNISSDFNKVSLFYSFEEAVDEAISLTAVTEHYRNKTWR